MGWGPALELPSCVTDVDAEDPGRDIVSDSDGLPNDVVRPLPLMMGETREDDGNEDPRFDVVTASEALLNRPLGSSVAPVLPAADAVVGAKDLELVSD